MDRLITVRLDHYDRETEVAITAAKGGVPAEMAAEIVDLVRYFRERDPTGQHPSIRASIMIGRVLACRGLSCDPADPVVLNTCRDVLHLGNPCGRASRPGPPEELQAVLEAIWGPRGGRAPHPRSAAPSPARVEEVLV